MKVIHVCRLCKKEFDVNELPDMQEFDEEGNWEYLCPVCQNPLIWGLK